MKRVEPQVYCIAETKINKGSLGRWLVDNDWEECLQHITGSDAEKTAEFMGRRCYASFKVGGEHSNPNLTKKREDSNEYHENVLKHQHGSVLRGGNSLWAFENVSRVFTHEVVRNSAGNCFAQESLRFVRLDNINYWVPPEIEDNKEAFEIFESTMAYLEQQQLKLAKIYDIDNIKDFDTKKKLTSAFRRIAPIGLSTGIIIGFNMQSLRWIIEQRTTRHAEVEIRLVFNKVAEIAVEKWPMVFQDFEKIDTEDGLFEWVPKYRKV